jgi:hypothetical protein
MHDIDRTQLESHGYGFLPEMGPGEVGTLESPFQEAQEIELASELLGITSEQELEQFLGNLVRTVGGAAGRFASSDTGRALGGILRGAARQALPVVGRAVGQWIQPGTGGAIGANIATQAGRLFGLELEGLSAEDREYEVARQFIRFAGAAAKQAALAPAGAAPMDAARTAAAAAAQTFAPGLLPRLQGRSSGLWPRTGRWVRRGRAIILYGG